VKILIIDSNIDLEVIYRRKLKAISDDVDFTTCLDKAKGLILKRKYDLILLSHILKKSDGTQAYNVLRSTGYTGPVIVTATGRSISSLRPQYNGIKGLVNKCLNGKAFAEKIVEITNSKEEQIKLEHKVI